MINIARSSKSFANIFALAVLLLLLLFQILWFVGTTTLRDIERLQQDYLSVVDDIARLSAAADSTGDPQGSAASLIKPLEDRRLFLEPQLESAVAAIKSWNRTWNWIVFWGDPQAGGSARDQGAIRSAGGATQVLGLYILPLLYGSLGAVLWVVQKLREDDSAKAVLRLKPGSRIVTGMVAGPMIGMFISPEFLSSLAFQATPFLIAFIGGYSTDVFFALIDRVLSGFRDAVTKPAKGGSAAADGGGTAGETTSSGG